MLSLAKDHAFGRALVNSGRLSVPAFLVDSSLNTADSAGDGFSGRMVPGAPMDDAPVRESGAEGWLLDKVGGRFVALYFVDDARALDAVTTATLAQLASGGIAVQPLLISRHPGSVDGVRQLEDSHGIAAQRYDARPGTVYLLRPDQHVAARWRTLDAGQLRAAVARATCNI